MLRNLTQYHSRNLLIVCCISTLLVLRHSAIYGQHEMEILNPMESKLNQSLPSFTTKAQILIKLGKPTKVEKANFECALTIEQEKAKVQQLYYYGKTSFFIYDKQAELMTIDFRAGKFVYKTPLIILTNKTTLEQLKKVYPQAVQTSVKENKGKMIRLSPCKACDGQVLLYMQNGKLVSLEFWEPC